MLDCCLLHHSKRTNTFTHVKLAATMLPMPITISIDFDTSHQARMLDGKFSLDAVDHHHLIICELNEIYIRRALLWTLIHGCPYICRTDSEKIAKLYDSVVSSFGRRVFNASYWKIVLFSNVCCYSYSGLSETTFAFLLRTSRFHVAQRRHSSADVFRASAEAMFCHLH